MQSGDNLDRNSDHIRPLVSLAETALRKNKGLALEGSPTLSKEILISTTDRRIRPVLADAIVVEGELPGLYENGQVGVAIQLFELSLLNPMAEAFSSIRQIRPHIISLACHNNISLNDLMGPTPYHRPALGLPAREEQTGSNDNRTVVDLLRVISEAIDLVDPLLPPGIALKTETKSSVLLAVSTSSLRHVIAQLLLEAADFASLAGSVLIRSELPQSSCENLTPDQIGDTKIRLTILGVRALGAFEGLASIERYFHRKVFPIRYKATVGIEHEKTFGKKDQTTLADEAFSQCLKIVKDEIRTQNLDLEIRRPKQHQLLLHLDIPLIKSKGPGDKGN
jgi:hypothetical protein